VMPYEFDFVKNFFVFFWNFFFCFWNNNFEFLGTMTTPRGPWAGDDVLWIWFCQEFFFFFWNSFFCFSKQQLSVPRNNGNTLVTSLRRRWCLLSLTLSRIFFIWNFLFCSSDQPQHYCDKLARIVSINDLQTLLKKVSGAYSDSFSPSFWAMKRGSRTPAGERGWSYKGLHRGGLEGVCYRCELSAWASPAF
jgi:hypothetical protein